MTTEKPFYVYVHRKATDGTVFYVGKGSFKRAYSFSKRNNYWNNVANKHGVDVQIVARFSKGECAFSFERALIKHYGRDNLCNLTDGGEGASNPSAETREKMSRAGKGRPKSAETCAKLSTSNKGKVNSHETRSKISASHKGKKLTAEHKLKISLSNIGRVFSCASRLKISESGIGKQAGSKHPKFDHTIYKFFNDNVGFVYSTQYDLKVKYNITGTHLNAVVNGKRKSHKGWKMAVFRYSAYVKPDAFSIIDANNV